MAWIGEFRALACVLLLSLMVTAPAQAGNERLAGGCPNDPPVAQVEGEPIYSDARGSVVDTDKLRRHEQQISPLRKFVTDASRGADSTDRSERECALDMMLEWANDRAMTVPPTDFGGLRELERFTISLNIVALKLRADGLKIEPLLDWLGKLNHLVMERFGARGHVDNLFVWSGVAAASYALLGGDDPSRRYASDVWTRGISAIRPDGFVDSELRRGPRALLYHVYNLSALLTLRAFRTALGDTLVGRDHASLLRLVDRVGSSLCEPSAMAAASGSTTQENPPAIEFAPIVAFAGEYADPRLRSCGPPDIPATDPVLGGNLKATAAVLALRVRIGLQK